MGTIEKINFFIDKLSKPALNVNIISFLLVWIMYCVASFTFSAESLDGWSSVFGPALYFLFYSIICLIGIAIVSFYSLKNKLWQISFYPTIFAVLVLLPQIFSTLFTVSDCGDAECKYHPNFYYS